MALCYYAYWGAAMRAEHHPRANTFSPRGVNFYESGALSLWLGVLAVCNTYMHCAYSR